MFGQNGLTLIEMFISNGFASAGWLNGSILPDGQMGNYQKDDSMGNDEGWLHEH